eukprot:SAG22_NODE_306_length_12671_cov_14.743239_9_plen_182_part_00
MPTLARTVPQLEAALFLGTWAACYAIAFGLGHVEPVLPMISDCLVLPPEGPVSRWGMVTAVNLLAANVLLTYRWLRRAERAGRALLAGGAAPLAPSSESSAAGRARAGCASARVDCALGLAAVLCGVFPMVVNEMEEVRQRSSLLKAVITAFPCVSLPFLAVPLRSQRTVAIRAWRRGGAM